jgi:hypothetical protein
MKQARSFWFAAIAALTCALAGFGACKSDDKPHSLVTSSGGSSGSTLGGRAGTENNANAGNAGLGEAGDATGEGGMLEAGGASPGPTASFPNELEADVGCNMVAPDVSLVIRNVGDEPLVITSASADSGYVVKTPLPLEIAPSTGGILLITPPAPSADADAGSTSMGKLTFTTNEPGKPTHEVTLTSTVFEGGLEFTDSNGTTITSLTLTYDSGGACPDLTKYRLQNTGNATITLQGPAFDDHFGGTRLDASNQAIVPGGYAELMVGAVSAPGAACEASGDLTFTVLGGVCGSAPALHVVWQQSSDPDAGTSCACTVPAL